MPGMDPGKVVVSGNGVQPRGVLASLPTTFLVDARKAGTADLDVMIQVGFHFILSLASEVGSPTNPPWAPGSNKTRGQGS